MNRKRRAESLKKRLKDSKDGEKLRDKPAVIMYLGKELINELDIRYDELNIRSKKENGERIGKNRDFYPAVLQAGLESDKLEDYLDL